MLAPEALTQTIKTPRKPSTHRLTTESPQDRDTLGVLLHNIGRVDIEQHNLTNTREQTGLRLNVHVRSITPLSHSDRFSSPIFCRFSLCSLESVASVLRSSSFYCLWSWYPSSAGHIFTVHHRGAESHVRGTATIQHGEMHGARADHVLGLLELSPGLAHVPVGR